ncbi:MAG TPA: flagellar motor stator protein MotA [Nannocystaceae bacterium]|nr:flagellar motor stator protein MotA [Nannocystaceae bacterium]
MISFVGLLLVIGAVLAGYVMHHGNLSVLNQPHEFVIILGAAAGSLIVSTPMKVTKAMVGQLKGLMGARPGKKEFLELLTLQYELFQLAQRSGLLGWEEHVNDPNKSSIFSKYPSVLKNHHALEFMTDTMKVIVSGSADPHDLENLMDVDMETVHAEEAKAPAALASVADAMPGLGIVAAVLGIVITMEKIDGPPGEVGMSVASALVGTFLGILLSYGIMGPLATAMGHMNAEMGKFVECMKHGLLAHAKGVSPSIAVEFARRSVSTIARPTFDELEKACRAAKG